MTKISFDVNRLNFTVSITWRVPLESTGNYESTFPVGRSGESKLQMFFVPARGNKEEWSDEEIWKGTIFGSTITVKIPFLQL